MKTQTVKIKDYVLEELLEQFGELHRLKLAQVVNELVWLGLKIRSVDGCLHSALSGS